MRGRVLLVSSMVVVCGLAVIPACSSGGSKPKAVAAAPQVDPPTMADQKPRDYAGVHNVVAYHEGFFSGSAPEGAEGFDSVAGMGVKTIISVDGAEPDLALAKTRGLRYIHLPIGYNGFDEQRKLELVRATRDAMKEGPVFIHCHHGKHRSAGAAAAVAASLGWSTPVAGVERMKVSGTAAGYKGLFECALESQVLGAEVIDAVPADFPEVTRPKGVVKTMVEIDIAAENLKMIEKAGWASPAEHPALSPAAEAGRLTDFCRLLESNSRVKREPAGFMDLLKENGARAQKLEDMLAAGSTDKTALSAQFKLVMNSCKDCHTTFRDDVPSGD